MTSASTNDWGIELIGGTHCKRASRSILRCDRLHRGWAMAVRLEHANLTVRDINGMIGFLQTAFPEFKVRGEGKSRDGSRWVHVGTDETYIALSPAREEAGRTLDAISGAAGRESSRLCGR